MKDEIDLLNRKNSMLLLFGVGISTLGDFIYLVAINILVLQITHSPVAVAGLWIMSPIASILTKFWSGSLIDRANKRKLMIVTDVFRALLVAIIPFLSSIWFIYICLFFLSVAKAFFEPTSMTYITKLIPQNERKQFNSFRSLITSGAFLVGPAIAGVLLMITSASISIWINAFSFLVSAVMLYLLPNIDKKEHSQTTSFSLHVLKQDWKHVYRFSCEHTYVVKVYFIAAFLMVISLGMAHKKLFLHSKS